uniref:FRG domain-containing protein n=1 Tax=Pantoea vagans TaxID=470934 RepID=UPI0030185305
LWSDWQSRPATGHSEVSLSASHAIVIRPELPVRSRQPTRLLDVTANPLVALYFCCADMLDKNEEENVGDVKIFSVQADDIRFYNSDTVSCIASLSLLNMEDQNKLIPETDVPLGERGEETAVMKRLLHFIRSEKPYFENGIRPGDLSRILFVRGRVANQRISSQSGAFLCLGTKLCCRIPGTAVSKWTAFMSAIRKRYCRSSVDLILSPAPSIPALKKRRKRLLAERKVKRR